MALVQPADNAEYNTQGPQPSWTAVANCSSFAGGIVVADHSRLVVAR